MTEHHGRCSARRKAFALLTIGLLLAASSQAIARPTPQVTDPTNPPQGVFADHWYAVRLVGQKAGHMHIVQRREGDIIHTRIDMLMHVVRDEASIRIENTDLSRETIDGKPLSFETRMKTGKTEIVFQGTIDDRIHLTVKQFGNEIQRDFPAKPAPKLTWGEFLEQLLRGSKPGTRYTTHIYNPGLKAEGPLPVDVEVLGPETVDLFGRKTEAIAMNQTMIGTTTKIWMAPDGTRLRLHTNMAAMPIEMILCSKAYALANVEPPELFVRSLIRTSTRLDPQQARSITYRLSLSDMGNLPDLPQTGMQRVIRRDATSATLTVSRQDHAALARAASKPRAQSLAQYLQASPYLNHKDAEVRALAQTAAGSEKQPYRLADKLRRFVTEAVREKSLNVGFATASEVARSREGDCSEHAVLLAALARANGLPARAVSGVVSVPSYGGRGAAFGYHMWTQVHLAGQWVDLDAAQHETDCNPTHIALAVMPLNDQGMADAALSLLNVIGRLKIEVEKVE